MFKSPRYNDTVTAGKVQTTDVRSSWCRLPVVHNRILEISLAPWLARDGMCWTLNEQRAASSEQRAAGSFISDIPTLLYVLHFVLLLTILYQEKWWSKFYRYLWWLCCRQLHRSPLYHQHRPGECRYITYSDVCIAISESFSWQLFVVLYVSRLRWYHYRSHH